MLVLGRAVGSAIEVQDPTIKTGTAPLVDRSWMTIVSRIKALSKNYWLRTFQIVVDEPCRPWRSCSSLLEISRSHTAGDITDQSIGCGPMILGDR